MALKKKFIEIEIPLLDTAIDVLGEPESLHKKTIKLDLTRKLHGRGREVVFVILNKDGKLIAYPKKMHLLKSYIRRMMRKRISYVEDSFERNCKDIKATIKPLLITRKKVSRAIRNNLRKTASEFITEYVKKKTYLGVAEDILHSTLQKEMLPKLKKIYPLSLCEIRVFETKESEKMQIEKQIQEGISKEEIMQENEAKNNSKEIEKSEETKKSQEEIKAEESAKENKDLKEIETKEEKKKTRKKSSKTTKEKKGE